MQKSQRIEDFHIQLFIRTHDVKLDSGPQLSESPDCLLKIDGQTVGLEHTRFFLPGNAGQPPQQRIDSLQGYAIEGARRLFRDRGGPALYVTATFDDGNSPRTKRDARELSERLATIVARNGWPTRRNEWRVESCPNIPAIHSYHVMQSVDGHDELWQGGAGGWVATVEPNHVQRCLDRKQSKYDDYVRGLAAVWLLIVNDWTDIGAPAEIGSEACKATYQTPFERAFWLDPIEGRVVDLLTVQESPMAEARP